MKKLMITILLFTAFLSACHEEGFKTYNGGRFISFLTDYTKDSVISTFFFFPDKDQLTVSLPVQLSGLPLLQSEKFAVSIVKEETTADPSTYKVEPEYTFREGLAIDTIKVTLNRTEALSQKHVTLVLQVDGSEILIPGQSQLRKAKIVFSALADQPAWWKDEIVTVYLGPYSILKYQEFIIATQGKGADLTGKEAAEIWDLARQFKYHLQRAADANRAILDVDNKPMTVPVIG